MYTSSPRITRVRPELEGLTEYFPGESLEAFSKRTGIPIERLIKLNSNESPYGPLPSVIKALGDYRNYNSYPDADATALRTALSAYTELDCPPTFSLYTSITTFCGASVLEIPRTANYEVDVNRILAALTPSTKLIVLCSPNNPTGNSIAEADVLALLESGRIVVIDEAYIEFSRRPKGLAQLVPNYPNLVVLRSFSKWAGLAGLRIGYGLFPVWIARYMLRAQCPFEVNVAGHIAAIETLAHLERVLADVRCIVQERERLFEMLNSQSYLTPFPSQGNFILARVCDANVMIEQVRTVVEEHGILLRYFQQPSMRDFLRVSVGLPDHTDRLGEALAKI